ncbi:MAG: M20/M25/M40 family metallo-hydrolase [Clostridia bacterium]|nr:M20/M25/M40 family metallo-hydrolase [Clostridia bacterium]
MLNLTKSFLNIFSVSGMEKKLAEVIREELKGVADDAFVDPMGNLLVLRKGKDSSKKLMIASHMDEIGFVVTGINSDGFVYVAPVGGINAVASSFHKVRFLNGLHGVIVPEHDVKPADLTPKKLVVDIGAKDKKAAEKKVKVGDLCAVEPSLQRLSGTRYTAKAYDDRIGCVLSVYAALHAGKPAYDTWFVFTVQEEVGCRGSKTAAFRIMPDYGIALDVTAADECGDGRPVTKLGGGVAIKIKDSSVLCAPCIVDRLTELAEQKEIPYQYEVLPYGGTDTSSIQIAGEGCAAGCISIPARYIHSPVETVDFKDLQACADLLIAFVENGMA